MSDRPEDNGNEKHHSDSAGSSREEEAPDVTASVRKDTLQTREEVADRSDESTDALLKSRRSSRPTTLSDQSDLFNRRHKKDAASRRADVNITVETPEGQRVVIRVKPEHTIKYLLETCCRRISVNSNDHYLVHNYKELHEGTTIFELGLTQNDIVRMYKGKKTILHRQIRVIVKIRDVRVGSIFKDTDTLWHILKILLAKEYIEADLIPIVLYNKEEFIGVELLSRVRLRDIGITTGTCSFKFLQLKKEDLDLRGVKTDDDENAMTTLESLELLAAGPTQDTGLRAVSFKTDDVEHSLQFLGERQALAFKQPDLGEEEIEAILREEYFDLTIEEIDYFYKEILKRHPGFENMNPMAALILARQEIEDLHVKRNNCEETVIRVQLPDKMVLQGIFSPNETINDVKTFVKKYVRELESDWELYRYDPKDILNPGSSLKELNCIPCAKLFMGGSMRTLSTEHVLLEDVNLVTNASADEAALVVRGDSLEQFFGSFDMDSIDVGVGGRSKTSGALKYRSKRQSGFDSFLRKSSGGLRKLRKSFGKASIASRASGTSAVSVARARRSVPIDQAHIRSIVRISRDDTDEEVERRSTIVMDDTDALRDSVTASRRETVKDGDDLGRDSVEERSPEPSSSGLRVNQPSTSKQSEPNPERNK